MSIDETPKTPESALRIPQNDDGLQSTVKSLRKLMGGICDPRTSNGYSSSDDENQYDLYLNESLPSFESPIVNNNSSTIVKSPEPKSMTSTRKVLFASTRQTSNTSEDPKDEETPKAQEPEAMIRKTCDEQKCTKGFWVPSMVILFLLVAVTSIVGLVPPSKIFQDQRRVTIPPEIPDVLREYYVRIQPFVRETMKASLEEITRQSLPSTAKVPHQPTSQPVETEFLDVLRGAYARTHTFVRETLGDILETLERTRVLEISRTKVRMEWLQETIGPEDVTRIEEAWKTILEKISLDPLIEKDIQEEAFDEAETDSEATPVFKKMKAPTDTMESTEELQLAESSIPMDEVADTLDDAYETVDDFTDPHTLKEEGDEANIFDDPDETFGDSTEPWIEKEEEEAGAKITTANDYSTEALILEEEEADVKIDEINVEPTECSIAENEEVSNEGSEHHAGASEGAEVEDEETLVHDSEVVLENQSQGEPIQIIDSEESLEIDEQIVEESKQSEVENPVMDEQQDVDNDGPLAVEETKNMPMGDDFIREEESFDTDDTDTPNTSEDENGAPIVEADAESMSNEIYNPKEIPTGDVMNEEADDSQLTDESEIVLQKEEISDDLESEETNSEELEDVAVEESIDSSDVAYASEQDEDLNDNNGDGERPIEDLQLEEREEVSLHDHKTEKVDNIEIDTNEDTANDPKASEFDASMLKEVTISSEEESTLETTVIDIPEEDLGPESRSTETWDEPLSEHLLNANESPKEGADQTLPENNGNVFVEQTIEPPVPTIHELKSTLHPSFPPQLDDIASMKASIEEIVGKSLPSTVKIPHQPTSQPVESLIQEIEAIVTKSDIPRRNDSATGENPVPSRPASRKQWIPNRGWMPRKQQAPTQA